VCPRIPPPVQVGGIRRGVHVVLRAAVWYAITPISQLFAIVLWLIATPLYPLGDLADGGLCNPVRGLYGD
jgi:hypothetical protein